MNSVSELAATGYRGTHLLLLSEALAKVRHDDINLFIVDYGLPDGEWLDLIAQLRAEASLTPAPVLRALDNLERRVRGLRAGVTTLCSSRSRRSKWSRRSRSR